MSYKDYLHAALDAVITKAISSGKDYRSVIPVPYTDIASEKGMKIHKDMTALGVEVVIEVSLTDRNEHDPEEGNSSASNQDKTRH